MAISLDRPNLSLKSVSPQLKSGWMDNSPMDPTLNSPARAMPAARRLNSEQNLIARTKLGAKPGSSLAGGLPKGMPERKPSRL